MKLILTHTNFWRFSQLGTFRVTAGSIVLYEHDLQRFHQKQLLETLTWRTFWVV